MVNRIDSIVKGTFMNAYERQTKNNKKFQVIQVMKNGGKAMSLIDIDNWGKPISAKQGEQIEIPVVISAFGNNGRVGLNIVHFD